MKDASAKARKERQAFVEKARELKCDDDPEAFRRMFSKVVPPKRKAPEEKAETEPPAKR